MAHPSHLPPQRVPLQRGAPGAPDPDLPTPAQLEAITATLRAIPMAAVAHTLSYRLLSANDDCTTLLELSADICGRPVSDFIPAADLGTALDTARSILSASLDDTALDEILLGDTVLHETVLGDTVLDDTVLDDTVAGGIEAPDDSASEARIPEAAGRPTSSLRRLISGNGRELTCWLHVGIATISGYRCFVACIDLVNPVLSQAHRWRHRAEHDELTGLRRRGTLLDQVAQWIDSHRTVMLAFLDIDNFKSINDTHGHAAGDHVLVTLARRLEQHAPPGCMAGRLSGDEFVLSHAVGGLDDHDAGPTNAHREADRLRLLAVGLRCVAEPIAWGEHLLMISISVGVTISEPGEDPATLLSRADDAMYAQKAGSVRQLR